MNSIPSYLRFFLHAIIGPTLLCGMILIALYSNQTPLTISLAICSAILGVIITVLSLQEMRAWSVVVDEENKKLHIELGELLIREKQSNAEQNKLKEQLQQIITAANVLENQRKEETALIDELKSHCQIAEQVVRETNQRIDAIGAELTQEKANATENSIRYVDAVVRIKEVEQSLAISGCRIDTLNNEKVLLEKTLQSLQHELNTVQQRELSLNGQHEELSGAFKQMQEHIHGLDQKRIALEYEHQRLQGLYKQLREQFEEKSQILTETRRELFRVQEEYHVLQREHAEQHQLGNHPYGAGLEKYLAKLEQDRQQQEHEVEALQQLIASLLTQLSK